MVFRTVKLNLSLSALSEPLRVVQQIRLNVPSLRREAPAAVLNLYLSSPFSFLSFLICQMQFFFLLPGFN